MDLWKKLFDYLNTDNCCNIKNLNLQQGHAGNQDVYVMNLCDISGMNNFMKEIEPEANDNLYIDPSYKLFIAVIPSTSKYFIDLFCCKISMENIYNKFADYGLAIEGCFNIEPITLLPNFYQGREFGSDDMLTMTGKEINLNPSYLVIDNHSILRILNKQGLEQYKPLGINVQYVEGYQLYEKGKPSLDLSEMKNIIIDGKQISGKNVTIDYNNLKIQANNMYYDFSDIGSKLIFQDERMFDTNNGLLVIAIDDNDNIFIVYHPHIDYFNMMLLLKIFNSKEAIIICSSSNAHIIWKENGYNTYNKTDFIGNPSDILSNIITFSA